MTTTAHKPPTTSSELFQWRSIKTRVTLFTLAIFLAAIWSLVFYASRLLRDDMKRMLGEQQLSTVSFMAASINEELNYRLRALEEIAKQITPAIMANPAAVQTLLEQRPALQILFNSGAFVVGIDGVVIADVPISWGRVGGNYSDREYMAEILKGKSTISKPVMGKKVKAPALPVAVPVKDSKGNVIGGLVTSNNLSKPNFLDKITEHSFGKIGGYLLLVDAQHRLIITASDKSRIMETLPAPGIKPALDSYIQGGERTGVVVSPMGVEVLTSAKGIPAAGWYLRIALPTVKAFAPIRTMQQRLMLATIFLTLLAGCLTWWMLKRQLAPVFTTIKSLTSLSDSDQYPQALPITSQDEIGELIASFNHLLGILGQREGALKDSEAEIRILNDDLDQRISERTAQLEIAYKEMEQFAYSVSHDLRAPLRSIDGFSLALLEDYEDILDEGGKNYLRRVRSATQKMAQLIDDILKLSRITRCELALETVNLTKMAEIIADELHSAEPERMVEFVIAKGLKTSGDSALLKVVLNNLLGNAWKFTGSHAEARIEFGSAKVDGKTAFFIRDDGAGFDAKYADKLFVTFQRLHSEQEFSGTGIGLSLVQLIIHRHGGTVWGEGAVEHGATFWFTIGC